MDITKLTAAQLKETMRPDVGSSDGITAAYLDSLLIETRRINVPMPDTSFEFCGETFATPIMAGGMARVGGVHPDGHNAYILAVREAGSVMWTGMTPDDEFADMCTRARCVRIIKAFEDRDKIFAAIKNDEACGAIAFSMDIDHPFTKRGEIHEFFGDRLAPVTTQELSDFARSTKLPFIAKGVLSVKDAEECAKAGIYGLLISHHQNIYPWAVPPMHLLPEIKKAVGNDIKVYIDCGLETGIDVFKALALGADGVCVARHLRKVFAAGGAGAVKGRIMDMTAELKGALAATASADICSIDPTVIHHRAF